MTELCQLAAKYGTDKVHYTPFYSMLLEGHRQTTRKVLEIGIGTPAAMCHVPGYKAGASLRMWEEYFPNAKIYGMDKDPAAIAAAIVNPCEGRVFTIHADQTEIDAKLIESLGPFDLIVDDGSHRATDQMTSLLNLHPHCRGLYIVEDADHELHAMLRAWDFDYTYAQVKGALIGHCMVLHG